MTDLGGLAVLVVEDEPLVADELTQALHESGARVLGPVTLVRNSDGGRIDALMSELR
jgi:DNA-binding response OmpR family regulator